MGVTGGRDVEEERLQKHWLEQTAIWCGAEEGAEQTWLGGSGQRSYGQLGLGAS